MTVTVETLGPAPLDPRARQYLVPMRDGVRLATDVYLPEGPGPFPAVLVRLPYDKNGRYCWMPFLATHFVARGYAFVPQDVRGKFRSEGEPVAFVNEVAGRLRHDRVDRAAAVVERRRRHVGRQLLRLHAVGRGGRPATRRSRRSSRASRSRTSTAGWRA